MQKVKLLICCIGCLHNFCIDEQLLQSGSTGIYSPKNTALSPEEVLLHERVADYNRNMSKSKGWTLQSSLLMLWMEKTLVNNQTTIDDK